MRLYFPFLFTPLQNNILLLSTTLWIAGIKIIKNKFLFWPGNIKYAKEYIMYMTLICLN